jgi:hypothetical protein
MMVVMMVMMMMMILKYIEHGPHRLMRLWPLDYLYIAILGSDHTFF